VLAAPQRRQNLGQQGGVASRCRAVCHLSDSASRLPEQRISVGTRPGDVSSQSAPPARGLTGKSLQRALIERPWSGDVRAERRSNCAPAFSASPAPAA
jgi:hypothetical protein